MDLSERQVDLPLCAYGGVREADEFQYGSRGSQMTQSSVRFGMGGDCWELSHIVCGRRTLQVNNQLVNSISKSAFGMYPKINSCGFALKRTLSY